MAKVLLSFSGNKLNVKEDFKFFPFYEGLIRALKRNGNDIQYMIANEFVASYNSRSNKVSPNLNFEKLDNYIKSQNFDLVIAFNNAIYDGYLQKSDIPYIIWGVDPISVYADKDKIKANPKRYILAGNCEEDYINIKNYFNTDNVNILRFATDVVSKKEQIENNISFVGSLWRSSEKELLKKGFEPIELRKIICKLRENTNLTLDELKMSLNSSKELLSQTTVFWLLHGIASNDRVKVLSALSDLGLNIYGLSEGWLDLADSNLDLACCYNKKLIYDITSTENLYNKSKIGFNMSHIHARGNGFSFRVLDIMASNACLVTDYKEGYKKLFGQYVDLPTFEYGNPQDARKVCNYLLNYENERKEIVKASNKAIEAEFRFEHRFKQIEEIVNVSLLNDSEGSIKRIKADDFIQKEEKENKKTLNFSFMPKQKTKKNFLEKIKNHLMKKREEFFRFVYDKYFSSPINSLLKQNAYKILPNPSLYNEKAYFESYIAKVSKGLPLKKEGEKIRVVFLFQEASYWVSIKTLYEKLKADDRFEIFVIAIPVLTVPHLNVFEIKDKHIEFLKENNIDYIDGRIAGRKCFDPFYLKPDYVFTQIHFDIQRSLECKSTILGLYTKVCLVPHAFLLSASDNSELIYQQNYFRIFVPNEEHKNILKSVIHRDDNIEVTGYPRFDLYKEKIEDCPIWNISKKENPNIKRIIWSPHWWAYGSTQELADKIFEFWAYFYNLAKENKDIEVIIKPHPNLLNGIVGNGFATEEEIEFLIKELDELDNISMYAGGEYFDLFKTADLMINNSISFLAEWLPSNKPMIFIDTERKFELNEKAEKILNVYYHIDNINDLNNQINNLLFKEQDYLKEKRRLLAEEFLPTEKDAADKIIESLIKHVND
ncbi:glycosyltransferase family protein [Campylobacter devanensis]|uniref:glycosyltransferase family protein n=1 Tax=Campylobacter devanensis TaxID=3161138 RepID=UPI000A346779|nr:glycosyltransferase [Campylobacter sp. P0111]